MIWTKINSMMPEDAKLRGIWQGLYAVPIPNTTTRWLIGPYEKLTDLATALRNNANLRKLLTSLGVRLGLRATDVPPTGDRQVRYGDTKAGANQNTDYNALRTHSVAKPALDLAPGESAPSNRRSDREDNVRTFWMSQTPQSHHIVEFNNLRDIKASTKEGKGEMDYKRLPAVLLAAEFHQRYISAFLKQMHGMKEKELRSVIPKLYQTLYLSRSDLFRPLWDVSEVLLREASVAIPP
jgi:hypothetical protein